MNSFLMDIAYVLLLILEFIVISGIIFNYILKKEGHNFWIWKSIFEIFVAKTTCYFTALVIWGALFALILLFVKILSLPFVVAQIWFAIVAILVYFFFLYKFLLSTLSYFVFDEESRKKIVREFIIFSEIIIFSLFNYLTYQPAITFFEKYSIL